ncbi:ATP-dependent DNA helicase PIF1 [Planococcus citri]|uniref:ATP-dependent DNA helicase PIF1 n=1 Tax=Planococcus citri TaxID=170843 RepID=UPI0031F993FE
MDSSVLQCAGTIEWTDQQKKVIKRTKYALVTVKLLRNEFRELVLSLESGKAVHKFYLNDVSIHKKFIAEGKATINFPKNNVVVMLSNAPSAQLVPFLKTLFVKITSKKQSPKVKLREQLLSEKPHKLDEISPVNSKDINRLKTDVHLREKILIDLQMKKKRAREDQTNQSAKKQTLLNLINNSKLTAEQEEVLKAATSKRNIFFTGSAGTGKSHLLRIIISALPPDETVATASTGAAACLIGGITLHSFTGIGGGNVTLQKGTELASRPYVAQNWRRCKYLIIDEISMVDGDYFEVIEHIARKVRKNEEPFGGIKLILCGDFLQLPPVNKNSKAKFCFQTAAWTRCKLQCFNLKQVHRQKDTIFISILNSIRVGRVTDEIIKQLKATSLNNLEKEGIVPTQLCCKTAEAQQINDSKLRQLEGKEYKFVAVDSHSEKVLDEQTPVVKTLVLKVGSQVMLLKNIHVSDGLVNGARGIVISFTRDDLPVVQFRSGMKRIVGKEKWVVKGSGGSVMTRIQIPLRLAWAFSIHKSQGLTLDCVEMSLSGIFEAGQAYVALSRAQSMDSLCVRDFDSKHVWANPDVIKFYKQMDFHANATKLHALGKRL